MGTGVAKTMGAKSIGQFHEVEIFHDREVRWAWSFHEFVFFNSKVMYGIGPSSLYEVIPGNRVGFAGEWPVTTYRTQESFQRWRHLGAVFRLTP